VNRPSRQRRQQMHLLEAICYGKIDPTMALVVEQIDEYVVTALPDSDRRSFDRRHSTMRSYHHLRRDSFVVILLRVKSARNPYPLN